MESRGKCGLVMEELPLDYMKLIVSLHKLRRALHTCLVLLIHIL